MDLGAGFLAEPTTAVEIKQVNDSEHQATHYFTAAVQCELLSTLVLLFFSLFLTLNICNWNLILSICLRKRSANINTSPSDPDDSWNKCCLKVKSSSQKKMVINNWEALQGNTLLLSDSNLKHFFPQLKKKNDPIYQFPQSDEVAGSSRVLPWSPPTAADSSHVIGIKLSPMSHTVKVTPDWGNGLFMAGQRSLMDRL